MGESPIDAIGSVYGVSRDLVKAVARRSARELGIEYDKDEPFSRDKYGPWGYTDYDFAPGPMFEMLASVPAQQRPSNQIQWRVFQELACRLGRGADHEGWQAWTDDIRRNALQSVARLGWPATIAIGTDEVDIDFALDRPQKIFWMPRLPHCALPQTEKPSPNDPPMMFFRRR